MSGSIVNIGWTSGCSYLTLDNVGDHLYNIILEENPDVAREKVVWFPGPRCNYAETPRIPIQMYHVLLCCTICSNTLLTLENVCDTSRGKILVATLIQMAYK